MVCQDPGMTATAADFTWFAKHFPDLADGYCITLVQGLAPASVLRRLDARDESRIIGADQLLAPAFKAWDHYDGRNLFVGVTAVGDWALMVEPNGFLGATPEVILPLSQGTSLVSHYSDINAVDHFYWVQDGVTRLHFLPQFPDRRDGTDPDGLADIMRQVGFDHPELHTESAFALAQHLTGVRLTPELLESATYLCGTAPVPA